MGLLDFIDRILHKRYVNNSYVPENFLPEVQKDIRFMRRFVGEHPEFLEFERDNDIYFGFLVKKYSQKYCPSNYYYLFSFENQVRYLYLRTEIDDILDAIKVKK